MKKIDVKFTNELTNDEIRQWNSLNSSDEKGRVYSSIEWLEMVEKSDGIAQQIVLLKENNTILMGMTFDLMPKNAPKQYNLDELLKGNSEYIDSKIPLKNMNNSYMPSVVFTARASRSYDIRYSKNLTTKDDLDDCFKLIYNFIFNKYCEDYNITFLYVPENNVILRRNLESLKLDKYAITGSYYKKIDYIDFSEYLDEYPSKKRSKIKNGINNLKNSEYEVIESELIDNLDKYVELVGMNFKKYGFPNFNFHSYKERMELLNHSFKGRSKLLNIQDQEGNIVASALYIIQDQVMHARGVGVDYGKSPKNIAPYFNIVYYEGIKKAIDIGASYFVVGDGLDKVKISRKMDLEKLFIYTNENSAEFKGNMKLINQYSENKFEDLFHGKKD